MNGLVMESISYLDMFRIRLFSTFLLFAALLFLNPGIAQEKPGGKKGGKLQQKEVKPPSLRQKVKVEKSQKNSKVFAPKSRVIVSEHRKLKRKVQLEEGDWIKFKMKDEKTNIKGKIMKIKPGKFTVDSIEYKLSEVTEITPKIFSQLKSKSKGYAQIGLGIPIMVAGALGVKLAYDQIDPNSPIVVASALGMTIGTGIFLYGVSHLHNGGKKVLARRKMKKKDGWRFSIR